MKYSIAIALVGAFSLVGCEKPAAFGPPEVAYGKVECAGCGMIVSNERFAAAIVPGVPHADALIFDDIGCMAEYEAAHSQQATARRYVHDAQTRAWVTAEQGVFVHDLAVHTPMGSGWSAFAPGTVSGSAIPYAQVLAAVASPVESGGADTAANAAR